MQMNVVARYPPAVGDVCRMYRGEYMHCGQVVYPVWALVCRRRARVWRIGAHARWAGAASDSDLLESSASDILSDSFTYAPARPVHARRRRRCRRVRDESASRPCTPGF